MRPKFRKYVTESEVRAYVTLFAHRASLVADPEPQPGVTPDPEDNYLIALGRVSGAHFLVSGDAHLTRLRRSQPPILTPRAFLTALLDTASPGGS